MTSHRKNKSKASQGGLTSPTLYDSGLDFPNRGRKTRKRRQVRISCINVTYSLSSVVIISHTNQLQICHTSRFVASQVLQKCFTESVARMSLWQECHTSRFVDCQVANLSRCRNVTLGSESALSPQNHPRPPQWKLARPPPVKISLDPLSGNM